MNILDAALARVWEASLSATVLIGLAWLVITCLRKLLPAWAAYAVWLLVFARLMVLTVPSAGFSIWNLQPRREEPQIASVTIAQSPTQTPVTLQTGSLRIEDVLPLIWLLGFLGWMAVAVVKHRRLARWVRQQESCGDPHLFSLVDRAQAAFGLRKRIRVICHDKFEAPAVFGVWRPRLLLPPQWVKRANDEELYAVLLHEVAHIKCRDALLNWICIAVRGMHWFNPAVWYAFRRLWREREVFCDALVLARLHPTRRAGYGNTLLRIACELSGATVSSTLVPILQHKPEIHRRIHMIANYKPTSWAVAAAFALLLIALAGLTFTRAADKTAPTSMSHATDRSKALVVLEKAIAEQENLVQRLRTESSDLGEKLSGPELSGSAEALQKLQARGMEATAEVLRLASLYDYLRKLSGEDVRRSINTAAPDELLSQLMQQKDAAEQKLAELLEERTPEHPDTKRLARVLAQINRQIEERVHGIMSGLAVRLSAEQAHVKSLAKALDEATSRYQERLRNSRPHQDSLRNLRTQEEILQRLRLRLAEEQINQALERTPQP